MLEFSIFDLLHDTGMPWWLASSANINRSNVLEY